MHDRLRVDCTAAGSWSFSSLTDALKLLKYNWLSQHTSTDLDLTGKGQASSPSAGQRHMAKGSA